MHLRARASADDDTACIRPRAVERTVGAGSKLGRYVLIEQVGLGAMGVVFRAYDPKLRREVALKRVFATGDDAQTDAQTVREARAMARLRSPYVVGVFDVEVLDGALTLVMEYVPGTTLASWLGETRHWSAVLDAFVQAGRGLVAAHRAGLLHRDFKPSNVLVGTDGRVRVTDFGLARGASESTGSGASWTVSGDGSSSELTQPGALLGTPAYMPPEQLEGMPIDERADVYAFCSSLWQAWTGRFPFGRASDLTTYVDLKRQGPPTWPSESRVPRRLLGAIRRGLMPTPAQRWSSMQALLTELQRRRDQRRRRPMLAVVGGLVLGAGVFGWQLQPDRSCSGGPESLARTWNEGRRQRLDEGFEGRSGSWTPVRSQLDTFAQAWVEGYERACLATARDGRPSAELDLRTVCLERARNRFDATLGVLEHGDATVLQRATDLLAGLDSPARCDDLEQLRSDTPRPRDPKVLAEIERAEAELDRIEALYHAGELEEASTLADEVRHEFAAVDYPPLRVEILLLASQLDARFDRLDAALSGFEAAFVLAIETDMPGRAVESAAGVLDIVGSTRDEFATARAWAGVAEGLVRARGVSSDQEAALLGTAATVSSDRGDYEAAEANLRRALALYHQRRGPEDLEVALTRNRLALVLSNRGKYEEAEREHRAVLAIRERLLGADHVVTAESRANLGEELRLLGRFPQAEVELAAALASFDATLGSQSANSDAVRNNLANVYFAWARYDRAEELYREVLAYRGRTFGPHHAETASALSNLGMVQHMRGDLDEAEASYRSALATIVAALGEQHPAVATRRSNLGSLLRERGQLEDARAELLLALRGLERSVGDAHVHTGIIRANYASVLSELGRHDEALAELERGIDRTRAVLGPGHVDVLVLRYQLGIAYRHAERYEQAEATQREVLQSRRQQLGSDHPDVAESLGELGNVLYFQKRLVEAEALQRDALATAERASGHDASAAAFHHSNLGTVLKDQRRFDEAEASYGRALTLWQAAHGDHDQRVAAVAQALGDLEHQRGRAAEARAWFERAWAIRSTTAGDPAEVAETAASLAEVLWSDPAERARALTLAREAERRFAAAGWARRKQLAAVRRWLKRHRVAAAR